MTVAEIKEYIDEHIDDDEEVHTTQELRTLYGSTLDEIKSMLDELEPKAKWLETDLWEDGIGDIYKCSNCGHNHLDNMNYCSSCGARMDNELEE